MSAQAISAQAISAPQRTIIADATFSNYLSGMLLFLQLTFPKPDDWNSPDRNQFTTKSVIGAQGTYNHLTDAVLDVNTTRAMYLRRLRNLADKYYGAGRLRQVKRLLISFCVRIVTRGRLTALGSTLQNTSLLWLKS